MAEAVALKFSAAELSELAALGVVWKALLRSLPNVGEIRDDPAPETTWDRY